MPDKNFQPVLWQYRSFDGPDTVTHGWQEWRELVPRVNQTMEQRLQEMRDYIASGSKYQLRSLVVCPTEHVELTTAVIDDGLKQHRLPHDRPSQLSDAFRLGAKWAFMSGMTATTADVSHTTDIAQVVQRVCELAVGEDPSVDLRARVAQLLTPLLKVIGADPVPVKQACDQYCNAQGFSPFTIRDLIWPAWKEAVLQYRLSRPIVAWRLDWPAEVGVGCRRWVGRDDEATKDRLVAMGAKAVPLYE